MCNTTGAVHIGRICRCRLDLSEIKVLTRDLKVDLTEDEVKEAFQVSHNVIPGQFPLCVNGVNMC